MGFHRLVVAAATTAPPDAAGDGYAQPEPVEVSPLELSILEGLAQGLSSAEIADRLHYSRQAISYHIGQMMTRGRVRNRTALVALAYERRILPRTGPSRTTFGGQHTG